MLLLNGINLELVKSMDSIFHWTTLEEHKRHVTFWRSDNLYMFIVMVHNKSLLAVVGLQALMYMSPKEKNQTCMQSQSIRQLNRKKTI